MYILVLFHARVYINVNHRHERCRPRIETVPIVKRNQNTGSICSSDQIFNHIGHCILFEISYRVGPVRTFKNTRFYWADPPKNLLHRPRNNDVRDPAYLCSQMHNVCGVIVVTQTLELRPPTDVFIVGLMIPFAQTLSAPRHNHQERVAYQILSVTFLLYPETRTINARSQTSASETSPLESTNRTPSPG